MRLSVRGMNGRSPLGAFSAGAAARSVAARRTALLFARTRRVRVSSFGEMAFEVVHGGEGERSLVRFGLDGAGGEDLVIGSGRRIASDQGWRPLRLFQDGFDRLERGQVSGAIDVDRALVLEPARFVYGVAALRFDRQWHSGGFLGRRSFGQRRDPEARWKERRFGGLRQELPKPVEPPDQNRDCERDHRGAGGDRSRQRIQDPDTRRQKINALISARHGGDQQNEAQEGDEYRHYAVNAHILPEPRRVRSQGFKEHKAFRVSRG